MDEVEQDTSGFMPVIGVIEVSNEIRRFRHLLFYFFLPEKPDDIDNYDQKIFFTCCH